MNVSILFRISLALTSLCVALSLPSTANLDHIDALQTNYPPDFSGTLHVIEIEEAQLTVKLRCPIKKCCKRLAKLTGAAIPSCTAAAAPRWNKWSAETQQWTSIRDDGQERRGSRAGRLRLHSNQSASLLGYYKCSPLPFDFGLLTPSGCDQRQIQVRLTAGTEVMSDNGGERSTAAVEVSTLSPETVARTEPSTSAPIPQAPFITSHDDIRLVSAGSTVTLECKAGGYPKPVITWLRGYTVIDFKKNSHLQQLADGSLRFSGVSRADQDTYRCVADNVYGHAYTRNQIWVRS